VKNQIYQLFITIYPHVKNTTILLAVLHCSFCGKLYFAQTGQTVTDSEGNVYKTVRIGNQIWMAENLRVTKYNDGTAIQHVTDSAAWAGLTTTGYCYYNNTTNPDTIKKWGTLYNWYVVSPDNPKKIAPPGWHVPTAYDWARLDHVLLYGYYRGIEEGAAKSLAAKTDWLPPKTPAYGPGIYISSNNRSCFSALPGGYRNSDGVFDLQGYYASWWSSSIFN